MFSIKNSKADCSKCKLLNSPSCILETNSEDDLSKVEIVLIAENPAKEEIEQGKPLVGRSGKKFRQYFDKYIKNNYKYLITNTVLCLTLKEDGTIGNPDNETIHRCKENCFHMIDVCKPKLIMLMGTSPMKAFDISENNITKLRGNIFKWKDYDVLLTLHPSFVNRNLNTTIEQNFEEDFKKVTKLLGDDNMKIKNTSIEDKIKIETNNTIVKDNVCYYRLPSKYYSDDYYLVDIQNLNRSGEILYIFRDKYDNKETYKTKSNYYYYEYTGNKQDAHKTLLYKDLVLKEINYRDKKNLSDDICYESDLKITAKHAIDYYLQKEKEREYNLKTLFFDIEINTKGIREFPNPEEAKHEVALISYHFNKKTTTYIINDPKQKIDLLDGEVIIFKNEKELLSKFIDNLREFDIDCISGWNSISFDLAYIYNRAKNIGLDPNKMSRFNECYIDIKYGHAHIPGIVCLDMLNLYKMFTLSKRENYKLGSIGQLEIGTTKITMEEDFSTIYSKDINHYIKYNRRDVTLLVDLNDKLEHIKFMNELKKLCSGSFDSANSSMGQTDGLIISYLKKRGIASKNSLKIKSDIQIPGAYVKEPIPDLYEYFCDFDFSALYPSLILTYNIGPNSIILKFKDQNDGYDFIYDFKNLSDNVCIIQNPMDNPQEIVIDKNKLFDFYIKNNLIVTINGCFYKSHDEEKSFFAEIIHMLLSSRKEYKTKMFDAKVSGNLSDAKLYDMKQSIFKIIVNTLYGVLANSYFRFFSPDLATSITRSGQEALKTSLIAAHYFIEKLKGEDIKETPKLNKKDMYTDENLSIQTNNIITGDTDSIFACYQDLIKDKNQEENLNQVREYNKQLQSYLNEEVLVDLVKRHNVKLEYSNLQLKNEIVARKGIFTAKKRYSLYIVEQEGRKIEEILTKGLETRRSDFGKYTKESLDELLNIILKSEDFSINKIKKFVSEKEKIFLKKIINGEKDIARPINFTKNIKDYKVVSQNIVAMTNFNILEYNTFSTGDKGYLYKIRGIDKLKAPKEIVEKYEIEFEKKGKKLEVIAIPDEMNKLPDYYIIDSRDMVKFAWNDRWNQLLSSILKMDEMDGVLKI